METIKKRNARDQHCESCGVLVAAGDGILKFIPDAHDDDDFARVGEYNERAHWIVTCADSNACSKRVETAKCEADEKTVARRVRKKIAN